MKRLFLLSLFTILAGHAPAQKISDLPSGSTPGDSDVIPAVQSGTTVKLTGSQIKSYAQTGMLSASNNLSDVANPATAATNLGISNGYGSTVSISGTSSLPVGRLGMITSQPVSISAGSGPYTAKISLSDAGVRTGDLMLLSISLPASTNPTLQIYDYNTSGTLLKTIASSGTATTLTLIFSNNGTAWTTLPKGDLRADLNLFDLPSPATARGNMGAAGLADNNVFSGSNTFPSLILSGDANAGGHNVSNIGSLSAMTITGGLPLMVYAGFGQNLQLGVSRDGYVFDPINTFYNPGSGNNVRDTHVLCQANDTYRRPLKIAGYYWAAHTSGNFGLVGYIGLAKSNDLVNWTHVADLSISGVSGTINNSWSPDWYTDGTNYYILLRVSNQSGSVYGTPGLGYIQVTNTSSFLSGSSPTFGNFTTGLGLPTGYNGADGPFKVGTTYYLGYDDSLNIRLGTSTSELSGYTDQGYIATHFPSDVVPNGFTATTSGASTTIVFSATTGLVDGMVYEISGTNIPANDQFTFSALGGTTQTLAHASTGSVSGSVTLYHNIESFQLVQISPTLFRLYFDDQIVGNIWYSESSTLATESAGATWSTAKPLIWNNYYNMSAGQPLQLTSLDDQMTALIASNAQRYFTYDQLQRAFNIQPPPNVFGQSTQGVGIVIGGSQVNGNGGTLVAGFGLSQITMFEPVSFATATANTIPVLDSGKKLGSATIGTGLQLSGSTLSVNGVILANSGAIAQTIQSSIPATGPLTFPLIIYNPNINGVAGFVCEGSDGNPHINLGWYNGGGGSGFSQWINTYGPLNLYVDAGGSQTLAATFTTSQGLDLVGNFTSGGTITAKVAGKGFQVKEGSNCKQGTATLSSGSAIVTNSAVTANSRILLTSNADGGTPGWLRVSARTAGTSFTITSSSGSDASTVAYEIFEPAP